MPSSLRTQRCGLQPCLNAPHAMRHPPCCPPLSSMPFSMRYPMPPYHPPPSSMPFSLPFSVPSSMPSCIRTLLMPCPSPVQRNAVRPPTTVSADPAFAGQGKFGGASPVSRSGYAGCATRGVHACRIGCTSCRGLPGAPLSSSSTTRPAGSHSPRPQHASAAGEGPRQGVPFSRALHLPPCVSCCPCAQNVLACSCPVALLLSSLLSSSSCYLRRPRGSSKLPRLPLQPHQIIALRELQLQLQRQRQLELRHLL